MSGGLGPGAASPGAPASRIGGATDAIVRRRDAAGRRLVEGMFAEAFPGWGEGERWLFVTPHDDDPAVAAALTLAAGRDAGARIRVRVVTDGRMGYTSVVSATDVVARRASETRDSFARLGIDDVAWFGYPDAQLHLWQGRRAVGAAAPGSAADAASALVAPNPHVVAGHTGLTNSITAELRAFRPTRLMVMSAADYHPDHRVVHQEALISIFHACGDIWPELGAPLDTVPWVHEFAAYAPFTEEPNVQIEGSAAHFDAKLAAIEAFASQTQIATLAAAIRASGPYEYSRAYRFETYTPSRYAPLFAPERAP